MSWIENIENIVFTIVTGDGKQWQPKWKNPIRSIEYNAALFEFVNVAGTLVMRREPKGQKYDLEFYFDGENAVQIGNDFVLSANNKGIWAIQHPYYGNFFAQPLSLTQDNTTFNCSKFTVAIVESLKDIFPKSFPIIENKISEAVTVTNELQVATYDNSGEVNKIALSENVSMFDKAYSKIIKTNEELLEFKKLVNNAVVELESVSGTILTIMRQIIALVNYPATIAQTIQERITIFEETFNTLFASNDGTREFKFRYETLGGAIMGAILLSTANNYEDDYETRLKVLAIQARISELYGTFLTRLDGLQTDRADSNDSYIPNFDNMNSLNEAVNYTISNLFNVAFEAKQEREYYTENDTNLILLTHKFYGLDKDDVNIDKFVRTNNIGLNEMLCIQKGRKIIYYV